MSKPLPAVAALTCLAVACGGPPSPGGPGPGGPPPGDPDPATRPAACPVDPLSIPFGRYLPATLPDAFVEAPRPPHGSPPPCAGTYVVGQSLTGVIWGDAFPGGVDGRVTGCVAGATWRGRVAPGVVGPPPAFACGAGRSSATITVDFAITYGADFDRLSLDEPPEACVYRSGLHVEAFDGPGDDNLDAAVRDRVRADVLRQLDRDVATELNLLPLGDVASGAPLRDGHDGRCPGWTEAAMPLP